MLLSEAPYKTRSEAHTHPSRQQAIKLCRCEAELDLLIKNCQNRCSRGPTEDLQPAEAAAQVRSRRHEIVKERLLRQRLRVFLRRLSGRRLPSAYPEIQELPPSSTRSPHLIALRYMIGICRCCQTTIAWGNRVASRNPTRRQLWRRFMIRGNVPWPVEDVEGSEDRPGVRSAELPRAICRMPVSAAAPHRSEGTRPKNV